MAEARRARGGDVGVRDPVPVRDLVPDPGPAHPASRLLTHHPGKCPTWQASGQWRGASGVVEREGTHVLRLAHPDDAAHERAAAEVAAAYKTRFRQESVMRERAHACTSF